MDTYDVGDPVQLRATFLVGLVPTDPATLTARVRKPDGTEVAYAYGTAPELVRESAGRYRLDLIPQVVGTWWVTWEPTGAGLAGQESAFAVRARQLCSLADLAALIQVPLDVGDASAMQAIAAATSAIRSYTGQLLTAVDGDVVLLSGRPGALWLPELPVRAVSAVSVDGTALLATDYAVDLVTGRLARLWDTYREGRGWWGGYRNVAVTYDHGYATLPDDLVNVCARIAARQYLAGKRAALVGPHAREADYTAIYQGEGTTDSFGAYGPTSAPILTGHEKLILDAYRPPKLGSG